MPRWYSCNRVELRCLLQLTMKSVFSSLFNICFRFEIMPSSPKITDRYLSTAPCFANVHANWILRDVKREGAKGRGRCLHLIRKQIKIDNWIAICNDTRPTDTLEVMQAIDALNYCDQFHFYFFTINLNFITEISFFLDRICNVMCHWTSHVCVSEMQQSVATRYRNAIGLHNVIARHPIANENTIILVIVFLNISFRTSVYLILIGNRAIARFSLRLSDGSLEFSFSSLSHWWW